MTHLRLSRMLAAGSVALSLHASPALAGGGCGADGRILHLADLYARLGSNAVFEDFESFDIPAGNAFAFDITCLDDSSIVNGQGPALVAPGATYCNPTDPVMQWNGDQYFDRTTKTILADSRGGAIHITYTQSVTAMGVELSGFSGYPYTGTATVYDTTNGVVGTVDFTLVSGGPERFFVGWANAGGIGRVEIQSPNYLWSPKLDDHVYGACPIVPPTQPFCFGDGVPLPCPCGNNGSTGNGCANSDHPAGANLAASGNPSLSADTLVLTATDLHAGSLQLYVQARGVVVPGLSLGDGKRCIGGKTTRLFRVKGAHSTTVSAPSADSIPPSPETISGLSAARGDVISAGEFRGYQVYYRDADPSFCPAPLGSSFNLTNAMQVLWAP